MHVLDLRLQLFQCLLHFLELLLPALPIPLLRLQAPAIRKNVSDTSTPGPFPTSWQLPYLPQGCSFWTCNTTEKQEWAPFQTARSLVCTAVAPCLLFSTQGNQLMNATAVVLCAPACSGPAAVRCAWPWSAAWSHCEHPGCCRHRRPRASPHSTSSRCPCSPQPPSSQTPEHVHSLFIRSLSPVAQPHEDSNPAHQQTAADIRSGPLKTAVPLILRQPFPISPPTPSFPSH